MTVRAVFYLVAALAIPAYSQPVVAPTPQAAGSPRGENAGAYTITNSFEAGYRFLSLDGSEGKYRSDVNFGNGIRLLGGSFGVHSRDGKGKWFDELLADLRGLGNDPYQFASFRLQKNSLYRYDLLWRASDYFNPALTIADGNHLLTTHRRLQDHELTLFPQSKAKIRLGYSGNGQTGPGLATGQWFDSRGDEFTYFADVRREQNEYRLGADLEWRKIKLSVTRGWETFKDDSRFDGLLRPAGANPADLTSLAILRRDEPYHGRTPFWRVLLHGSAASRLTIQGRLTHSDGERGFAFDEVAQGADRLGLDRRRQILVSGNARRPFTTGSASIVWLPSTQWTLSNQSAYSNVRMEGDGRYVEVANGVRGLNRLAFQYLGVRLLSNASEASWQPVKPVGVFGSYHFADRRIRSALLEEIALPQTIAPVEQSNRQKAGIAGVRLQPIEPLRILFRIEAGRNNAPFYPTSDKNYHAYTARATFRRRAGNLNADFRSFSNANSTSLFQHSSRGRTWTAGGAWTPAPQVQFDAGYQYLHQEALTGLAYFADFQLVENTRSFYLSNLHTFHAGGQWQIRKRIDFYAGLVRSQDRGDGRSSPAASSRPDVLGSTAAAPLFAAAQVYPLSYTSPLARISIALHSKLRWNFGWQYYDYEEKFSAAQNYQAHTGYVSLSYSF